MKKYKIYYPYKKYNKDDNILFINFHTNTDKDIDIYINILKNYTNKTRLYDPNILFFNNSDKINEIIKNKINIISFDGDIQMTINKIMNKKKEIIGVLSKKKNINCIIELEKVYDIDYSSNSQYFLTKDIPLCIIDIENTPEYNKLLENRVSKKNHQTFINNSKCENILYQLFIKNYWNDQINFIKIYRNCYFSNTVALPIKNAIIKKYMFLEENPNEPLIYFGDCNNNDYEKILNHKSIVFIIWMNIKDESKKIKILKKKNNIFHFAATKFILKELDNYNINAKLFQIHITDTTIFKPVEKKGDKILIFQSKNFHQELVKLLPDYDFIFSNKYNLDNPLISLELFKKCFIAIRLTDFDGYIHAVDQLKDMNIPIVHNFSNYGLKWNTIDDVKNHILKNSPPIIRYNHQYSFDLCKGKLNSENLGMIYNNLDECCDLICKYTNILFISNKNDKIITDFIKKKNNEININFIYLFGNDHIQNIDNRYDLIIIEGDCEVDIQKYYKVPTIFLVDNIFLDDLDVPFWDNSCYKYINLRVIDKIKKYDVSFVNSQHINKVLKNYNLTCKLFYWEFIPYYGKSILKNDYRKYDYGIIKGSNYSNEIELLGKNIIIEEYSVLKKYLHDIKYFIYDVKYESSSQIKVDIFMNDCIYIIPKNIIFRKQNILQFKKGANYILKFEGCIITEKIKYGLSFIEGVNDKEFIIYYFAENNLEIRELDFIRMQKINNDIVGYNPNYLKNIDLEYLYYAYGYIDNENILSRLGLLNIFTYYSNELINKKYNVELLKRKWCYDLGKNGSNLDVSDFATFVLKYSDNIISKKCLFISKKITGHGGNQKTALQIIKLLERYFIVEIFSNNMNEKEYNFMKDSLDYRIHNMKIIKKKKDDFIRHISQNNYEFIVNNKFNEYFDIAEKIIHPRIYVITHNSMDPFNKLIIKNQNYITKVFTINKFHQTVLQNHGLKIPIGIFYNYVDNEIYKKRRLIFKKRLCFIGRFTKEKNLELLIAGIKKLDNIELVIIGCDNKTGEDNKKIIWKGILQKDEIICELRECDYLIVPSMTEGLPFVILEAMNIGVPCIYSRIIGSDELIGKNEERGFTFELIGYENYKMKIDWSVFEEVDKHFEENIENIKECIQNAYSISIKDWNKMSKKCKKFIRNHYFENKTNIKNLESFEIIL